MANRGALLRATALIPVSAMAKHALHRRVAWTSPAVWTTAADLIVSAVRVIRHTRACPMVAAKIGVAQPRVGADLIVSAAPTRPITPVRPTVAAKIGGAEWMLVAAPTVFVEKPGFIQMRFLVSPTTVAKVCRVQIFRTVGQTVFAQPIKLAPPIHSPVYPITRARVCNATMMRVAGQIANAPVSRVCRFLQMSSQLSILY